MPETVHRFHHDGISGAVLRVAEDGTISLNSLLVATHRRPVEETLRFPYTACYLLHRGCHVLIDAGISAAHMTEDLRSIGVVPEEVTWVLITHADWDHVRGLLDSNGNPAYPRARYAIDAGLWRVLAEPASLERVAENRRPFYASLIHRLGGRVTLCQGETEILGGIQFIPAPGHRTGHAIYEIETSGTPLLHLGDALFQPFQVEEPWTRLEGNADEDRAIETRQSLVARALRTEALVLASHFPWPGIGRIRLHGGRPAWVPSSDTLD